MRFAGLFSAPGVAELMPFFPIMLLPLITDELALIRPHPNSPHALAAPLAWTPRLNMDNSKKDNRCTQHVTSSSTASSALSVQSKFWQSRSPIMVLNNDNRKRRASSARPSIADSSSAEEDRRDVDLPRALLVSWVVRSSRLVNSIPDRK